ncbi:Cytochrome P450 9e2 [Eumeta japonica]|uniref:unspecific monooxygenase n=1 Tax=Eumeta variegata TaxID=151549 RepID=A0A4C1XLV5_EUMVA|nr:Cytochrome P450 9e2 [Eumeta japonica]
MSSGLRRDCPVRAFGFNGSRLELCRKFTDDDLVAQAVLFYVAGLDTTSNLINFFLYEMAMNPEVQKKLQEELDAVPDSDSTNDLYERIQSMEYLDMTVSEVLRLWPLAGAYDRRSTATYDFGPTAEGSKHHLVAEAGIHIWIPAFCLHRDPRYWELPERCVPERFSPSRRADIVPYTYLPFGTGPRACIGSRFAVLTAKIVLARLLREFEVGRSARTPAPQRLAPRAFILRPARGFFLNIRPRHVVTEGQTS